MLTKAEKESSRYEPTRKKPTEIKKEQKWNNGTIKEPKAYKFGNTQLDFSFTAHISFKKN